MYFNWLFLKQKRDVHVVGVWQDFVVIRAGSGVPREGFHSSVMIPFSWCVVAVILYSVSPHTVSSLHIYIFFVSRAFMAGAASQARGADSSLHLVSHLVCRGPWMPTVVLYCWCHSDSASVLLYFTFNYKFSPICSCLVFKVDPVSYDVIV